MDYFQAFLLGLVEGITEYLPVSSTGHLLVVQRLLGIAPSEASNAYAVAIQGGAIAAVLGLYRRRIAQIFLGLTGRDGAGARLALCLVVAFVPAAAIGFAFDDAIERVLFGVWPVVIAWAAGGVLILLVAARVRGREGLSVEAIGPKVAFWVGLAQCAALWPGVSRSLSTILGGLLMGLSLAAAVEFSFLLGLLTLGAATAYKTLDSGQAMLEAYGLVPILIGFLAAWVSAVLAVRWMVAWLGRNGIAVFGWWRLVAAIAVGALLMTGTLSAE